jgi:hypothetical protein
MQAMILLIEYGLNVNEGRLMSATSRRMIETPGDYTHEVIGLMCENGIHVRALSEFLLMLVELYAPWVEVRDPWVYEVARCLLHHGAFIYNVNGRIGPYVMSIRRTTAVARLIQETNLAIKFVKNLHRYGVNTFERAVHKEPLLDVPVKQWEKYVHNFTRTVNEIVANERNGYLVLKHPSSKAHVLPHDCFIHVMTFLTSAKAKSRIKKWSRCAFFL